jgi:hypothetical protein
VVLARFTYVLVYCLLPTGALLMLFPNVIGWVALAALAPLVVWRAARMTVREWEGGLCVRNFWRSYQIDREEIEVIDRVVNPPTIFVPFPNADCPRLTMKDGRKVYVVLGTGGTRSVYSTLAALGARVPDNGRRMANPLG